MITILIIFITNIISFIVGAAWLQAKETKFGILARFNCENCGAYGCQYKWCKKLREKNNDR